MAAQIFNFPYIPSHFAGMEIKTTPTLLMLAFSWALSLPSLQGLANLTFTVLSIAYVVLQMRAYVHRSKKENEPKA